MSAYKRCIFTDKILKAEIQKQEENMFGGNFGSNAVLKDYNLIDLEFEYHATFLYIQNLLFIHKASQ